MKKSELIENLNFIKNNHLLGQTASLLKVIRIQANSQYQKRYGNPHNSCSDFFNIDENIIEYQDTEINKILPFVKIVYHLFNNNGYRHSDVALFSVLYDENTPLILKEIPYNISKMEYDILSYLLKLDDVTEWKEILNTIFTCCYSTVTTIRNSLNQIEKINNNIKSVKKYYDDVFFNIYMNLSNIINNMIVYNDIGDLL